MSRIGRRFARLREAGEKALVPFVTAGDPDLATTAELVVAMAESGADAIELGIPFSDPIADGGIICPDLPPEEGADLYGALEKAGIDGVLLAAPTTTPARLRMLVERTRGFLYCVSLTGVTGARATVAQGVEASVRAAKALRDVPVCVGFGVSTPAHAAEIGRYADGVVVGGAVVDRIERAKSRDEAVSAVARFVAELKAPLRAASR